MTTHWQGHILAFTIEGTSHGPQMTAKLNGLPSGIPIDEKALASLMAQRAPGMTPWSTPRKEADVVELLSGVRDGVTDGSALTLRIANTNTRSADYAATTHTPRPGHADWPYYARYGKSIEPGGGSFSGRLTAPLTAAGGLCLQIIGTYGIAIESFIEQIGSVIQHSATVTPAMEAEIASVKAEGDSVGGLLSIQVSGLAPGLGEGYFEGIDCALGAAYFAIPAVRAVEFGAGTAVAGMRGSQNNDEYFGNAAALKTFTNNHGGLLGGMTTGMPLEAYLSIKPTPSIAYEQRSVDMETGEAVTMQTKGRHDPCLVPRILPVARAVTALVLLDVLLDDKRSRDE